MEGFFDLSDHVFANENALVSQYHKALILCVERHSPARIFLVLRALRDSSTALELCPDMNMAAGVCHTVPITLGLAQWRTVDDQLAIDQPKNSEMRCAI